MSSKKGKKSKSYMQKIKSKNYIVIGTAHLGIDLAVLNTIKTVADFYDAKVIHTGPLATTYEIAMWRRRKQLLHTWENAAAEKIQHQEQKTSQELEQVYATR